MACNRWSWRCSSSLRSPTRVLTLPVHDYISSACQHSGPVHRRGPSGLSPFQGRALVTPRPEAMRVPAELVQKKPPVRKSSTEVTWGKKRNLAHVKPEIPAPG